LPVEGVVATQLETAAKAILFFEIPRCETGKILADVEEERTRLVGADGEGGSESGQAEGFGGRLSPGETVCETAPAAWPLFRFVFKAGDPLQPGVVIVIVHLERNIEEFAETENLLEPFVILCGGGDIAVGEKEGDPVSVRRQPLQATGCAGGAADMEKDALCFVHGITSRD